MLVMLLQNNYQHLVAMLVIVVLKRFSIVIIQRKIPDYKIGLPSKVADFKMVSATFTADFESGA